MTQDQKNYFVTGLGLGVLGMLFADLISNLNLPF